MRLEAVLFDFDGTIADTEPVHHDCWQKVLSTRGVDLTWDYYRTHCIGISDRDMLAALGQLAGLSQEENELQRLYSLKKSLFQQVTKARQVIPDENREAVLAIENVRLGVVTSCARSDIEPILLREGILPKLAATVYGDEVTKLKPAPEPYLLALRRLGVNSALVFEDSQAGLESARSAGCRAVQVKHPADLPKLLMGEGLLRESGD